MDRHPLSEGPHSEVSPSRQHFRKLAQVYPSRPPDILDGSRSSQPPDPRIRTKQRASRGGRSLSREARHPRTPPFTLALAKNHPSLVRRLRNLRSHVMRLPLSLLSRPAQRFSPPRERSIFLGWIGLRLVPPGCADFIESFAFVFFRPPPMLLTNSVSFLFCVGRSPLTRASFAARLILVLFLLAPQDRRLLHPIPPPPASPRRNSTLWFSLDRLAHAVQPLVTL